MEKTLIRWVFGSIIVFLITICIMVSSTQISNTKITITSDSNTYNITKVLSDTMIVIQEKQDFYYKEMIVCQAKLQANGLK